VQMLGIFRGDVWGCLDVSSRTEISGASSVPNGPRTWIGGDRII
jgi:hypothetical protein